MGPWSAYLIVRTFISPVDFFTDTIHAAQLMNHGHPIWGILTLLLPILGKNHFVMADTKIYQKI